MRVPQGHPTERDLMALLESVRPLIQRKLTLRGVKFQLAVAEELRKDAPNGTVGLMVRVFRTKQIAMR